MLSAFGQLLPIAVAAAVSSVPIMAMLVILLSPRRGQNAIPVLIGSVLGALLVLGLATLAAALIPQGRPRQAQSTIGVLEILIGGALVLLGVLTLRRRPDPGEGGTPKWAGALDSFGAGPSFGIGLALNFRPKGVLLSAAAGLVLRSASLGPEDSLALIVLYTGIATSTVTAPILATLFYPDRMEPRLQAGRDWMTSHGHVVTAVMMLVIAAVITVAGIRRL
jgi:hypothetical protein